MGWRDVQYRLEHRSDEGIAAVVGAINRTHVNGGALIRCLRPIGPAFDEAFRNDLRGLTYVLSAFLESDSLRSLVPELKISVPIEPFPQFISYGSYEFEGAITGLLLSSGAYIEPELDTADARLMAWCFVDSLLGDARDSASVFRIADSWCQWFHGVAWDISFAILDPIGGRWWLLCVTDTD